MKTATATMEMTAENFALLLKENESYERQIEKLEDEVSDLKDEVYDFTEIKEALELFADASNWKDGKIWHPVAAHIERDYPDMIASKALEGCS